MAETFVFQRIASTEMSMDKRDRQPLQCLFQYCLYSGISWNIRKLSFQY